MIQDQELCKNWLDFKMAATNSEFQKKRLGNLMYMAY